MPYNGGSDALQNHAQAAPRSANRPRAVTVSYLQATRL